MSLIKRAAKSKRRFISTVLLEKQAECIGRMVVSKPERSVYTKVGRDQKLLNGVWELLHVILDDLEDKKKCVLERK